MELRPTEAFNSLFTVYAPVSLFASLVHPCLPLYVSLYLSTLPIHCFITQLHTGTAFPLLFLFLCHSIFVSLALTFCLFSGCLMQTSIWAEKPSFCHSLSVSIQTPLCFTNMTDRSLSLLTVWAGLILDVLTENYSLLHVHEWLKQNWFLCANFMATAERNGPLSLITSGKEVTCSSVSICWLVGLSAG